MPRGDDGRRSESLDQSCCIAIIRVLAAKTSTAADTPAIDIAKSLGDKFRRLKDLRLTDARSRTWGIRQHRANGPRLPPRRPWPPCRRLPRLSTRGATSGSASSATRMQWTLGYAALAYTLLHATEMVSDALDWPHLIARIVTIVLLARRPRGGAPRVVPRP